MSVWDFARGAGLAGGGALAGGLIGGPVGAAIGAGLGGLMAGLLGEDDDSGLPAELEYRDDTDGRQFIIRAQFPDDETLGVALLVLDEDGDCIRGRREYKDSDGDFLVSASYSSERGGAAVFVPSGALDVEEGDETVALIVWLDEDGEILGDSRVPLGEWPRQRQYSAAYQLAPLTHLARLVAVSDGPLSGNEIELVVNALATAFESKQKDFEVLREQLTEPSELVLDDILESLSLRIPDVNIYDVLDLLLEIAEADAQVTEPEVATIKRVALEMGLAPGEWDAFATECGLMQSSTAVSEAYSILELEFGAALVEVKGAYRRLLREYHPDTVAGLPQGFQDYARTRTIQIVEAYRVLVAHLGG